MIDPNTQIGPATQRETVPEKPTQFQDPLVEIRELENLLSEITGLCFDFIFPNYENLYPSDFSPICQLMHTSHAGKKACQECTADAIMRCLKTKQSIILECHIGLIDAYVPLFRNDNIIGMLSCGQFLFEKPTRTKYNKIRNTLRDYDIYLTEQEMETFYIPVFPEKKFRALTKIMSSFGSFLSAAEQKLLEIKMVELKVPYARAKVYIENNYQYDITLDDVANKTNISKFHLSHLIKSHEGKSFTHFVNHLRIERAKNLLTNTDMLVSEISPYVGFNTLSHFNHTFKKYTALRPLDYRKQNRTKQNRTN